MDESIVNMEQSFIGFVALRVTKSNFESWFPLSKEIPNEHIKKLMAPINEEIKNEDEVIPQQKGKFSTEFSSNFHNPSLTISSIRFSKIKKNDFYFILKKKFR